MFFSLYIFEKIFFDLVFKVNQRDQGNLSEEDWVHLNVNC